MRVNATTDKTKYLLGIDIGTSGLKMALVDLGGRTVARYHQASAIMQPAPGYVEQDADAAWWDGVVAGVRHCLAQSEVRSEEIGGICTTGMVPNLCPLDADGNVVRPAILYRDNRAIREVEALNRQYGGGFTLQDVLPKLLWLKRHEPESFGRIRMVLNTHSYVAYKLTGAYSTDDGSADIFGDVYDCEEKSWMVEKVRDIGLDPAILPPVYTPMDVVGTVHQRAADLTGLAPGTPVLAGTGDSYTVLVGSGVVNAGEGVIYLGTAGTFLGLKTSLADLLPTKTCPFISGDVAFIGNVLMGGEISRWYKDSFLGQPDMPLAELDKLAEAVPAGSDRLFALPHLLGERTPVENPLAKGAFFGLTNAHTRAHAYRALLEGVAYVVRDSAEAAGVPLERIVICGGGAGCRLWRSIFAAVLKRPLEYQPSGGNALGTAYMVGLALGLFNDFSVIRDEWLRDKEMVPVDDAMAMRYDSYYAFYKELNALLGPAGQKLAGLPG